MQNSQAMQAFVAGLLKQHLPDFYFYHSPEHTLYVAEQAMAIGRAENCTPAEIDLLQAAALWHDTGFLNTYLNHEEESCVLARQHLPSYDYSAASIDTICEMIMATKMPQSPQNKLECILADADLEYLGTMQAGEKAMDLFRELSYQDPLLTHSVWMDSQVAFLLKHRYFTRFCKEHRELAKQAYLQRLLNGIE